MQHIKLKLGHVFYINYDYGIFSLSCTLIPEKLLWQSNSRIKSINIVLSQYLDVTIHVTLISLVIKYNRRFIIYMLTYAYL